LLHRSNETGVGHVKKFGALAGALFLCFAQAASATVFVQHSGSTNPGTEGFTNDVSGPVYGSPVLSPPAWNMTGSWNTNYNQFLLTAAQSAALWSETWTLTAIMQNLSTGSGFGSGIYADVLVANQRFDIDLSADGAGDQVLSDSGSSPYTIAGLGTDYATFKMVYSPTSHTVDYYVNGTLAISNSPGVSENFPSVLFGGVDGNFSLVSLTTAVPEPSTWALMLVGFGGLGLSALSRVGKGRRATAAA